MTSFALKSILSDTRIVTLACFLLPFLDPKVASVFDGETHFFIGNQWILFHLILKIWVFCLYVWLWHHICAWCPRRFEEGIRSPETEVTDDCQLPYGCRELNSIFSPDLDSCIFFLYFLFSFYFYFTLFIWFFKIESLYITPAVLELAFLLWRLGWHWTQEICLCLLPES